jgi:hypothetical protein
MDRRTFYVIAAIGALLHGALYLAGVFFAALTMHNTTAALLAIVTAGVTYLSFLAHVARVTALANMLAMLSIVCGLVAGGWLLA